jgi:hypothetical protein
MSCIMPFQAHATAKLRKTFNIAKNDSKKITKKEIKERIGKQR